MKNLIIAEEAVQEGFDLPQRGRMARMRQKGVQFCAILSRLYGFS
jgi:hypothetical protein